MYNMENNRRSFFKGLATFASGVVAAKVASYTPKKEEPKEEIFVPSTLAITYEGEQYHPLVVKKTDVDKTEFVNSKSGGPFTMEYKSTLRKANV
jgi:hypothetical protein